MEEIEKEIDYLKKSPIFAMSLGSKELFHTNFWYWLIQQDKNFIKVFFPNVLDADKICLNKREKDNFDISFEYLGKRFILENKLKSLPQIEQLNNYESKTDNFGGGVLTWLTEPNFELPKGWGFVSYITICDKIRKTLKESTSETIKMYNIIIEEYCNVLEKMTDVLTYFLSEKKDTFDFSCKYLDNIRLSDIYKKIKANHFLDYTKSNLTKYQNVTNGDYLVEFWQGQGFSRGEPILDFRFCVNDLREITSKKEIGIIGVQLQGNQLRLCVQIACTGKSKDISNKIYYKFLDYLNFAKSLKMKNKYCSYKTNNYCFVYTYKDLLNNHKYEELCKDIKTNLDYIYLFIVNYTNKIIDCYMEFNKKE